jgi:drug/metabolite transporter (DMT)-like permease
MFNKSLQQTAGGVKTNQLRFYNSPIFLQGMSMPKTRLIPYIEVFFAVVVWGASFIATKVALVYVSPITIVWLRFAMGVVILGIAVALRRQFALPNKNEWGYFALLGFLGITFHQWLQSNGLITSEASTTAWIVATTPVFMALLGWLVLKEGLGWVRIFGILVAFMGVLVVVSDGVITSISIRRFGAPGDVLILISAVNWAVFSTLSRHGLKAHPASLMMFYVMSFGWIFTSILFIPSEGLSEIPHLTLHGWIGVLFLGIFCSGLAYIAWYDALQALSAAQTGAFLYIEPLVAVAVAAVILAEPVTWASVLGGAVILIGVWLVNREERRRL